jgi:hypothetical protein
MHALVVMQDILFVVVRTNVCDFSFKKMILRIETNYSRIRAHSCKTRRQECKVLMTICYNMQYALTAID